MRFIFAFLTLFFLLSNVYAQNYKGISVISSDMRVTGKLAVSQMFVELHQNFSGGVHEFDNKPGLGFGVDVSKQLSLNWEIGAGLILSTLKGEAVSPDFSAIGHHGAMQEPFTEPLVYKSQFWGKKVFVQYNFVIGSYRNFTNPFIRLGVGYLPYRSELRYRDRWTAGIIFGKALEEYEKSKVSTAVYSLTPGIRTEIFKNTEFVASVNINLVNYDFLDVVHNYNAAGERLQMRSIYADFMVGISFLLNDSGRYKILTKRPQREGKTRNYLPFYRR